MSKILSGLFTSSILKQIELVSFIGNEFDRFTENRKYKLCEGFVSGKTNIEGEELLQLNFENALKGKNRNLKVLVSSEFKFDIYPVVSETKSLENKTDEKCFLYFFNYYGFEDKSYLNKLIDFTAQLDDSPEKFLYDSEKNELLLNSKRIIIFCINFSNIYNAKDYITVTWTKTDNVWKVSRNSYFMKFCKIIRKTDIKWKSRNLTALVLLYIFLIILYPIDLITLPLQLFFLRGIVK